MKNVIQFECFETKLSIDDFAIGWEFYAKKLLVNHVEIRLHQRVGGSSKFKYISRHEWPEDNFNFNFMKGRNANFFPEENVSVIQAGGYIPLQIQHVSDGTDAYKKIFLFLPPSDSSIKKYKDLTAYYYLNIYQPYFESCKYGYILEFFADEHQAAFLTGSVNTDKSLVEYGIYKECAVLHE